MNDPDTSVSMDKRKAFLINLKIIEIAFESLPQLILQFYIIDLDSLANFINNYRIQKTFSFDALEREQLYQLFSISISFISTSLYLTRFAFLKRIDEHDRFYELSGKLFRWEFFIKLVRFISNVLFLASRFLVIIFFIRETPIIALLFLLAHVTIRSVYLFMNFSSSESLDIIMRLFFGFIQALLEMFTFFDFLLKKKLESVIFYTILALQNLVISMVLLFVINCPLFTLKAFCILTVTFYLSLLIDIGNHFLYFKLLERHVSNNGYEMVKKGGNYEFEPVMTNYSA